MKRLTGILKIKNNKNKNMPFKSKGNKMFFSFFFHVQSRTSGYNDFRVVIRQYCGYIQNRCQIIPAISFTSFLLMITHYSWRTDRHGWNPLRIKSLQDLIPPLSFSIILSAKIPWIEEKKWREKILSKFGKLKWAWKEIIKVWKEAHEKLFHATSPMPKLFF